MPKIVRTLSDHLYHVRDTGNPDLDHVWFGVAVKHVKAGVFTPKKNAREILVRKLGAVEVKGVLA